MSGKKIYSPGIRAGLFRSIKTNTGKHRGAVFAASFISTIHLYSGFYDEPARLYFPLPFDKTNSKNGLERHTAGNDEH
jgi:hypothetical protein